MTPSYAADNYFTIKVTYPNKKTKSYRSTQSLNLTKISTTSKHTTIKLTKVVKNGKSISLNKVTFSFDYLTNAKHIHSLIATKATLSLPTNFLKASAYKNNARLSLRIQTSAVEDVNPQFILPLKETKYHSNKTLLSLSHLKYGLYGSKKKGLQLTNNTLLVNNKNLSHYAYAWWTSEYKYINNKWQAATMLVSLNYPFKYDSSQTYSAYSFTINRNHKGYIQSLILKNIYTYQGVNSYGEIWKKASINDRDSTSLALTKNWVLKDTFKYSYVLKAPSLTKLTAKKKAIQVTWKKDNNADGYQIRYSTSKEFKNVKTLKIDNYKTVKATLSSLYHNKTYYIKIRSYGVVDEKTYYSPYSQVLSIKTK